jgi:hypothetical protein
MGFEFKLDDFINKHMSDLPIAFFDEAAAAVTDVPPPVRF